MTRRQQALACAAAFAVALPLVVLWPYPLTPRFDATPSSVIRPVAAPEIGAVYERPLFAVAEGGDDMPADAPALVGIAGRLNRDAVALVRLADGSSRSLGVGESVDGWRLESLAIDAAFFTRGRERVRVAMSTPDAAEEPVAGEPAADEPAQ